MNLLDNVMNILDECARLIKESCYTSWMERMPTASEGQSRPLAPPLEGRRRRAPD